MEKPQKLELNPASTLAAAARHVVEEPCFIDFEASSLDLIASYPIEVGICLPGNIVHSWLLKPAPLWNDWSEDAAKVHGISREQLQEEGYNIVDVARQLNALVPGFAVCDAMSYDTFWLHRLFKAAKMQQSFQLDSLASLLTSQQINNWASTRRQVTMKTGLITHRAGNDARILYETWRRIIGIS